MRMLVVNVLFLFISLNPIVLSQVTFSAWGNGHFESLPEQWVHRDYTIKNICTNLYVDGAEDPKYIRYPTEAISAIDHIIERDGFVSVQEALLEIKLIPNTTKHGNLYRYLRRLLLTIYISMDRLEFLIRMNDLGEGMDPARLLHVFFSKDGDHADASLNFYTTKDPLKTRSSALRLWYNAVFGAASHGTAMTIADLNLSQVPKSVFGLDKHKSRTAIVVAPPRDIVREMLNREKDRIRLRSMDESMLLVPPSVGVSIKDDSSETAETQNGAVNPKKRKQVSRNPTSDSENDSSKRLATNRNPLEEEDPLVDPSGYADESAFAPLFVFADKHFDFDKFPVGSSLSDSLDDTPVANLGYWPEGDSWVTLLSDEELRRLRQQPEE